MDKNYDVRAVIIDTCEKEGVRFEERNFGDGSSVSLNKGVAVLRGEAAKLFKSVLESRERRRAAGEIVD